MKPFILFFSSLLACLAVWAHEGHGMEGTHWHATDAWGFIVVGVLIVFTIWLTRGGK